MDDIEFMPMNMANAQKMLAQSVFGDKWGEYIKYVQPLQGNWFVPTTGTEETISTWIGYAILSIQPKLSSITRTGEDGQTVLLKNSKVTIRIASVGPQAEDIIRGTLFWVAREDVKEVWEQSLAQIMNNPRRVNTFVYNEEGFNSSLCWTTDVDLMCWITSDIIQQERWCTMKLSGGKLESPLDSN